MSASPDGNGWTDSGIRSIRRSGTQRRELRTINEGSTSTAAPRLIHTVVNSEAGKGAVWTRSRTGSRDGIDENRGRKYPISCLIRVADKLLPSLSPPLTARAMCDETGARSREGRDDDGKPVALVSDPGDPRTAFTECCRRDERRRTQTPPTGPTSKRDATHILRRRTNLTT